MRQTAASVGRVMRGFHAGRVIALMNAASVCITTHPLIHVAHSANANRASSLTVDQEVRAHWLIE